MSELSTRTPEAIGAEIREIAANVRRVALGAAIEIGRRLSEAKELLPHGEWSVWLEKETEYSQRQAQRMMQLYDAYGAAQIGIFGAELKATALTDLSITNALLLVTIPENEREEFAANVDAEHISSRELEAAIRERDELKKQLEDAEARADRVVGPYKEAAARAESERDGLAAELEELRNKPVDVAVQEPDPAELQKRVDEAVAAAMRGVEDAAPYKKKLEAAEKKLAKANEALEKAKEQSAGDAAPYKAEVEKAKADAEKAQAEADRLRRELALSDADTTAFKLYFEELQRNWGLAFGLLNRAEGEKADKLRAAMRALAESFGRAVA